MADPTPKDIARDLAKLQYHIQQCMEVFEKYKRADPDPRWRKWFASTFIIMQSINNKANEYRTALGA